MPLDARIDAWARLALRGLPQRTLVELLEQFADPQAVLAASRKDLGRVVPPSGVDRILAPVPEDRLATTLRWLDAPDHEIVAWDDTDYPRALLEVADAPPILFFVGRRELLNRASLAVVGSRNATPQGIENARAFAAAFSAAGLTVVSGMALGIDAAAHEGALDGPGGTLAVVGTGLDRVYPAKHRALAHAIALKGALVSEYPPGTPPLKENFPRRNRLLSGLARGVLVVEATLSSGSLITARLAGDQGRDVFAIPGSIHSPFSKGPHKLIREGAKLVETAQDVLDELKGFVAVSALASAPAAGGDLVAHAGLLDAMAYDPVDLDTLMQRTRSGPEILAAALTALELDGHVVALPGGRWQRVVSRPRA